MARDRKGDILANHGVHIAGTDFDRRIELTSILPEFGYGAFGPAARGALALTEGDRVELIAPRHRSHRRSARTTVAHAGLEPSRVDALYFTGGSTDLQMLTRRLAVAFASARLP